MSNQQKTLSNIGTDCCREPRSWEIEIAMAIWLLVKIGVPKDRLHLEPSFGGVVVIRKNITVTMWICVKIWCLQNLFFEVIGQFGHFRRIPNLWRNTDQRCFFMGFCHTTHKFCGEQLTACIGRHTSTPSLKGTSHITAGWWYRRSHSWICRVDAVNGLCGGFETLPRGGCCS